MALFFICLRKIAWPDGITPDAGDYLDERGIPHLLVREDAMSISDECHERIEKFVRSIEAGR